MTDNALSLDPSGKKACTTRKIMGWSVFLTGILFMAIDLTINGGVNVIGLGAYTGTGPALYNTSRMMHEFNVRKLNGE